MEKTLREICNMMDVSRRAVQGYEKVGLVAPSGRNSRGYLLYDEEAQKQIKKIRTFQEFGFSINEIKEYIDAPPDVLKAALQNQLKKLNMEKERLEITVQEIRRMIDAM